LYVGKVPPPLKKGGTQSCSKKKKRGKKKKTFLKMGKKKSSRKPASPEEKKTRAGGGKKKKGGTDNPTRGDPNLTGIPEERRQYPGDPPGGSGLQKVPKKKKGKGIRGGKTLSPPIPGGKRGGSLG